MSLHPEYILNTACRNTGRLCDRLQLLVQSNRFGAEHRTSIQNNLLAQMGDTAVEGASIHVIKCRCPIVMYSPNDLPPAALHCVINLKITTGETARDLIHFPPAMIADWGEVRLHLHRERWRSSISTTFSFLLMGKCYWELCLKHWVTFGWVLLKLKWDESSGVIKSSRDEIKTANSTAK